jgi:medium-chain acyl-CoA synthetase
MMLPRLPEWWELALGMIRMGVVVVPSTMLLVSKDIEYRLEASGARAFIGSTESAQHFLKVKNVPKTLEFTILVEDYYNTTPLPESRYKWNIYSEMIEQFKEGTKWRGTQFHAEDPSIIYFTSGTIGMPKMVQHTQISYPMGCVITGKYWLKLEPGKVYWNTSEQGWAKAAWSFFGTYVSPLSLQSIPTSPPSKSPETSLCLHLTNDRTVEQPYS